MSESQINIAGSDAVFTQSAGDSILRAALRAGIGFPYECNAGGCGSCKFELLQGEVETLWEDAPGLSSRDRQRGKRLACQNRAISNCQIKVRTGQGYASHILPHRFQARLEEVADITHDIREFRFRDADVDANATARFLPGQYALFELPGVEGTRAYSMSNTPNPRGEWQFQIRHVPTGKGSAYLFGHLKPGDSIEIDGPYGLAYLRPDSTRNIVCVAGGSGLAPVVSIVRGAAEAGMLANRQLYFFYGGRTARDICGEAFLRELPGYGKHIHYYPVVSLPDEYPDLVWQGEVGYVHELVRRTLAEQLKAFEYYFAGPPPMSQALQETLLVGYQVPFEQIHFDRFF